MPPRDLGSAGILGEWLPKRVEPAAWKPRRRDLCAQAPDVAKILQGNVYGWFERIERGVYGLTERGRGALVTWAGHLRGEVGVAA